jgi:hypothetical protein
MGLLQIYDCLRLRPLASSRNRSTVQPAWVMMAPTVPGAMSPRCLGIAMVKGPLTIRVWRPPSVSIQPPSRRNALMSIRRVTPRTYGGI